VITSPSRIAGDMLEPVAAKRTGVPPRSSATHTSENRGALRMA
jgi:hypothetical protein